MKIKINGEDYKKGSKLKFDLAEPILVEVQNGKDVYINHCPGDRKYIQYNINDQCSIEIFSDNQKISIPIEIGNQSESNLDKLKKGFSERRVKDTKINALLTEKRGISKKGKYPYIIAEQDVLLSDNISLRIGNFKANKTDSFKWTIGKRTFSTPQVNISIKDYLRKSELFTPIEVSCIINEDNKFKGIQTFTLWNDYELNKLRGTIQPEIKAPEFINQQSDYYAFPIIIYNQEDKIPITLTHRVVELLREEGESKYLPIETLNTTINANKSVELKTNIKASELTDKNIFGIAVHLKGIAGNKMPVSASAYAELSDRITATLIPSTQNDILKSLFKALPVSTPTNIYSLNHQQVADSTKYYIQENIEKISSKHLVEIQATLKNPVFIDPKRLELLEKLYNINNACSEEEEGQEKMKADGKYVCQIVPDSYETVLVAPRIMNAKKGDIILTPGGNTFIGPMMRAVTPPQFYSHCGIMVKNFKEVRHSTASEEWLSDNVRTDDGAGFSELLDPDAVVIPRGFYPPALKYAWPGTITQTIENAYYGEKMPTKQLIRVQGPIFHEKEYTIKGFSKNNSHPSGWGAIEPKVVKPDPFDEAEDFENTPNVRSILHEVAEKAKSIDGHYRFYCYTDADIFFKEGYNITEQAKNLFWDDNRNPQKPTVCSSFIWAAIKSLDRKNIVIEGELDHDDTVGPLKDAKIDNKTKDGLYLYDEEERQDAIQIMYDSIKDVAEETIPGFLEFFNPAAKKKLGNQICNTFAFDNASLEDMDSDKWRNPKLGRAVSPDDILNYWDKMRFGNLKYGLYGHNEKLIFRPARYVNMPKYRWYKVEEKSKITGKVIDYLGNPCPNIVVKYTANQHVMTNQKGEFKVELFKGSYTLESFMTQSNGQIISGEKRIEVRENEDQNNILLTLNPPTENYREIYLKTDAKITNKEVFGSDIITYIKRIEGETNGGRIILSSVPGENNFKKKVEFQFIDRGNEIRVEYTLNLTLDRDNSLKVDYAILFYEGASGNAASTNDLNGSASGEFTVTKDGVVTHEVNLISDEPSPFTRGRDAVLTTFTVKNLLSSQL